MQQNFSGYFLFFVFENLCFYSIEYDIAFSELRRIEVYLFYEIMIDFFSWRSPCEHVGEYDTYFSLLLAEEDHTFCIVLQLIGVMEDSSIGIVEYIDPVAQFPGFFRIINIGMKTYIRGKEDCIVDELFCQCRMYWIDSPSTCHDRITIFHRNKHGKFFLGENLYFFYVERGKSLFLKEEWFEDDTREILHRELCRGGKLSFFWDAFLLFPFDDSDDYIGEFTQYGNIGIFLEADLAISPESCKTQYEEKGCITDEKSIDRS